MNPLRAILRSAARFLRQSRCKHIDTLRKTEGKRMFTECLRCEYQSKGVEIAGHDYASTKHSWEPAPRMPVAPELAMPVLGNLAGHARSARRKPAVKTKRKPRKLNRDKLHPVVRKSVELCLGKPRKISAIKPRKTSRKPSSKRSKTA